MHFLMEYLYWKGSNSKFHNESVSGWDWLHFIACLSFPYIVVSICAELSNYCEFFKQYFLSIDNICANMIFPFVFMIGLFFFLKKWMKSYEFNPSWYCRMFHFLCTGDTIYLLGMENGMRIVYVTKYNR